jgi:hypothetical protein
MNTSAQRILVDALLFASLLWLPWWCSALIALAAVFIFEWYLEAVIAGFLMDSLYGVPSARFHGFTFLATAAGGIMLAVSLYARPKLRYNK